MGANADLVGQMYEAFGKGDIPSVIASLADDVEWSVPSTLPQGGTFAGRTGVVKFFEGLGATWADLSLDIEAVGEIGDDLVVSVVRGKGTLRGGGPSEYGVVHVLTVRDGAVVRFREYADLDAPIS